MIFNCKLVLGELLVEEVLKIFERQGVTLLMQTVSFFLLDLEALVGKMRCRILD